MRLRERGREEPAAPRPDTGGEDPEQLERLRRAGEEFLAAGDDAIRRALSGDSEAFLRASRQQGGE
jgi:hypothetical protein